MRDNNTEQYNKALGQNTRAANTFTQHTHTHESNNKNMWLIYICSSLSHCPFICGTQLTPCLAANKCTTEKKILCYRMVTPAGSNANVKHILINRSESRNSYSKISSLEMVFLFFFVNGNVTAWNRRHFWIWLKKSQNDGGTLCCHRTEAKKYCWLRGWCRFCKGHMHWYTRTQYNHGYDVILTF